MTPSLSVGISPNKAISLGWQCGGIDQRAMRAGWRASNGRAVARKEIPTMETQNTETLEQVEDQDEEFVLVEESQYVPALIQDC